MYNIILPEKGPKPSYYAAYVGYVRKILEYNNIPYLLKGTVNVGEVQSPTATKFLMIINDKKVVIDYSDNVDHMPNWSSFNAYFKFHYVENRQENCKTIYPFAPISFYDWKQYEQLRNVIKYTCNNNVVLNMQRPGGNAIERRGAVQKLLRERYGNNAILNSREPQISYWKRIANCLAHVFVPGCRNDMIDRGHIQYLGFGCCTIAPPIVDILPFNEGLVPGVHYIQCNSDYSNLVEKIEWCKNNRKKCVDIGENAKQLFSKTCTPQVLWKWILKNI